MSRKTPQRLYRKADVCDACGSADSFRVTGKYRNIDYLRCAVCGRRATRLTLKGEGRKNENQEKL